MRAHLRNANAVLCSNALDGGSLLHHGCRGYMLSNGTTLHELGMIGSILRALLSFAIGRSGRQENEAKYELWSQHGVDCSKVRLTVSRVHELNDGCSSQHAQMEMAIKLFPFYTSKTSDSKTQA